MEPLRIHLCGRLVVRVGDRRVEDALPGRQGRQLFAYLLLNRLRPLSRDQLVDALWPQGAPAAADTALSALLSKLRRLFGPSCLEGRSEVRLSLPEGSWVDVEAASDALHRAEGAAARGDWAAVWGPARVVQHVCGRPFLAGEDVDWVEEARRKLGDAYLRSLELVAEACLHLGSSELATAERAARTLVRTAPLRESGHRTLMRVLAARDDRAGALLVYDELRALLRDELGVAPSASTQAFHRGLLE